MAFKHTQFNTEVAVNYGVPVAVVFAYVSYKCRSIKGSTFQSSAEDIRSEYPFLSVKTVRRAMAELIELGVFKKLSSNDPKGMKVSFHPEKMVTENGFQIVNVDEARAYFKSQETEDDTDSVFEAPQKKAEPPVKERKAAKATPVPAPDNVANAPVRSAGPEKQAEDYDHERALAAVKSYADAWADNYTYEDAVTAGMPEKTDAYYHGTAPHSERRPEFNYIVDNSFARELFHVMFPRKYTDTDGVDWDGMYSTLRIASEAWVNTCLSPAVNMSKMTNEAFKDSSRLRSALDQKDIWEAAQMAVLIYEMSFGDEKRPSKRIMPVPPGEMCIRHRRDFAEEAVRCLGLRSTRKVIYKAKQLGVTIDEHLEAVVEEILKVFEEKARPTYRILYGAKHKHSEEELALIEDRDIDEHIPESFLALRAATRHK